MKPNLNKFLLGGAMLALMACQAAAQKINSITTDKVGNGLEVKILGGGLPEPKITRDMGGKSFTLEFDATLTEPQWLKVEHAGVHYIQSAWSQTTPPKVRIHLRLDADSKVTVDKNGEGYVLKVNRDSTTAQPAPTTAAHAPTLAPPLKVQLISNDHEPAAEPRRHQSVKLVTPNSIPIVDMANNAAGKGHMVSLDFVNTDVVQILKALAIQAGVNIVTAPDVKGQLTVSLGHVSVDTALNWITTLAGVKCAQVGNTYLVTSRDTFEGMISKVDPNLNLHVETRVVPLYSGEGQEIKNALKDTAGAVTLLLPSEKAGQTGSAMPAAGGAPATSQGGAPATSAPATGGSSPTGTAKVSDPYVVLMGPSDRVDGVDKMVRALDEQMCEVIGKNFPHMNDAVIRSVYHAKGNTAVNLLQTLSGSAADKTAGGFSAKVGTVEVFATPPSSTTQQVLVLNGRESEVNRILENLETLDTIAQSAGDYMVYDVKYLDPRSLREDLVVQFPGLSASIAPNSVGNPNTYHAGLGTQEGTQKTGEAVGNGGSSQSSNDSGSKLEGSTNYQASNGSEIGLTGALNEAEKLAVPMKLILRGTKEQIDGAMAYLQAVDVAPKQVALELRVMQLSKEDALKLGLDWSLLTGGTLQNFRMNQSVGNTADTPGTASGGLKFPGGGLLNVTAALDQLNDKNHLIARPNLLAIDGRSAELFVGDDVKYIQSVQSTQNGVTVTTGDVSVGVRLAVLPRIGGDNAITMDMRPTVSTLTGFTPVPGGGSLPQTSLRTAQSTVQMESGETLAIGGLIQDQDSKNVSGIPILKDLPIIGMFFKRVNNDHQRTEVVFFLTAKVVTAADRQNAANPMRGGSMMDNHK